MGADSASTAPRTLVAYPDPARRGLSRRAASRRTASRPIPHQGAMLDRQADHEVGSQVSKLSFFGCHAALQLARGGGARHLPCNSLSVASFFFKSVIFVVLIIFRELDPIGR